MQETEFCSSYMYNLNRCCSIEKLCYVHVHLKFQCRSSLLLSSRHEIEKVFELKIQQVYFIYLFPHLLKRGKSFTNMVCQFPFCLSWHFKWEKSIFWRASFMQNNNWLCVWNFVFMYYTSRRVRISLLISAITKSFAFFLGRVNL